MKRLLLLIVSLLLLAIGVSFAVHNAEPVQLSYYFGTVSGPISLIVVVALFAGAVLGVVTSLVIVLAQRRKVSQLRRKLEVCEQEIRNLRQIPVRDKH